MAELRSVAACFPVADISTTIQWYEEQLGFTADPFPVCEPYVFAVLYRDRVEIFLQRVDDYQKPDLYNSVRENATIIEPLHHQPYGNWEFEIKDPNGYVLVFSEEG